MDDKRPGFRIFADGNMGVLRTACLEDSFSPSQGLHLRTGSGHISFRSLYRFSCSMPLTHKAMKNLIYPLFLFDTLSANLRYPCKSFRAVLRPRLNWLLQILLLHYIQVPRLITLS